MTDLVLRLDVIQHFPFLVDGIYVLEFLRRPHCMHDVHGDDMPAESIEYVSGTRKIKHHFGWATVNNSFNLAMNKRCNSQVPSCISSHPQSKK